MTLRRRALRVDPQAIIAQRLKRLSSIEVKLRRFHSMKLSQMQDIGGCRAVVKTVDQLDQLASLYKRSLSKNPRGRHEFMNEDDYVKEPKDDGYRGIHMIYRYHSRAKEHSTWNHLKIEIQLRSRSQHSWATAVEIVDTFTGDTLKVGAGDKDWKRFFALMGTAIAIRERKPLVPGTPTTKDELVSELRRSNTRLRVEHSFQMWRSAIHHLPLPKHSPEAYFFLLFLDTEAGTFTVRDFRQDQQLGAQEAYTDAEKRVEENPSAQAVLVSVDKISMIRIAYPNYAVDTEWFMKEVDRAVK